MQIDQKVMDKLVEKGMNEIVMVPVDLSSPYAAYQEWAARMARFAHAAYEAGYRQASGELIIKGAGTDGQ